MLLSAILVGLAPASALALDARIEQPLPSDANTEWAAVGDFCSIAKWHPAVAECQLSERDGKTFRQLTLKNGAKLVERLEAQGPGMSYTYTIVEGPLPVKNYKSTISIAPAGDKSVLTWVGTFESNGVPDAEAVTTITGIYGAGAQALATAK
jgi:hypothetical protein